ncbi:glycosyltransferase family 2 protein [Vibrio methylphosphonaticus]|uniref:glycosyltransferase family 2 protein n=1 Tax=Vibrio methylphosphonaticus TaxID=2946866 RepID=UPI00202AB765|nr:glycosyltransferase family A protein [Vibrio methylphosphonaticus]MCL9775466.1 glycosyltransferase family 2 protein [Vibrio methylphosphonaticus]
MEFSIIIPAYNIELFIVRALDSIKNQVLLPEVFEVIIIDDGSTDDTLNVINNYRRKNSSLNIKVISQENQGVSAARNNGIKHAKGELIYFLDGDDYISYDFFSHVMNAYDKSTELYITSYTKVMGSKKISFINKVIDVRAPKVIIEYIVGKIYLNMCVLIFRRDIIERLELGFDEGTHYGEDLEFYHKYMFSINNISVVPDAMFNYVFRTDSAVNSKVGLERAQAISALLRVNDFITSRDFSCKLKSSYYRQYIPEHILKVIYNLVREGCFHEAISISKNKTYNRLLKKSKLTGRQMLKSWFASCCPHAFVFVLILLINFRTVRRRYYER